MTFRTARLHLRPVSPDDAAPIFASYACDAEVTRYMTWRPHRTRDDTDRYVAHCLGTPCDVARAYAILDRETGLLRGMLDLRHPSRHRLEFGYVLARAWWGQGLMTEALVEVASWALSQPLIFRIGSVCDVDNTASARVMQKAGLTLEGVRRRWLVHPNMADEPRDCLSYALVR